MNDYSPFFESDWVQAIGWTLLHSIWQGVAIAFLLAITLLLVRKGPANMKYLFGIIALSGLLVSMVITFSLIYTPAPETEPLNDPDKAGYYAVDQSDNSALHSDLYKPVNEEPSLSSAFISYFEEHMPFMLFLYLFGVLILTMRMLGELVYLQNLRYSRSQFVSEIWQEKLKELSTKMGINTTIVLKESIQVSSPMIIGFLKPIIFIPIGLLANLPSNQIESILAHELAHIRRHDYLFNLLQSFVEILLFFNPAVWWISSFIRSEREHCCDDIAIELTGDKLTFARTLANLEEWRIQSGRLAVAFAGNRNSGVLGRIQRLLEKKESTQLPFRLFWSVMILTAGFLFTAFHVNDATSKSNYSNTDFETTYMIGQQTQVANTNKQFLIPNQTDNPEHDLGLDSKSRFNDTEKLSLENSNVDTERTVLSTFNHDPQNQFDNNMVLSKTQIIRDTNPDNIKKMKYEMRDLEQSFQLKREGLVKQMKELETKRYAIEKEAQKQNFELQTAQLQLQKEMQKIEKEKMMAERDIALQRNNQEGIIMELQYKMQELELELDMKQEALSENETDEKAKKEIMDKRKEIQEIRKAIMFQEKEINRKELETRKHVLLKEKEVQEILYANQLREYENQMNAHSKEAELLKFQESMQLLEMQMSELDYALRNNLNQLQQKIEMEEAEY